MLRRAVCRVAAAAVQPRQQRLVSAVAQLPQSQSSRMVLGRAASPAADVGGSSSSRRGLSTTARGGGGGKAGEDKPAGKTQAEKFAEFEASLDANELRPLLAENAEELLREAAEAIPFAPGPRNNRRKKQHRERQRVVRRNDYVRKLERVAAHEARMQRRSGAAINERLARLGLAPLPKKQGQQAAEEA